MLVFLFLLSFMQLQKTQSSSSNSRHCLPTMTNPQKKNSTGLLQQQHKQQQHPDSSLHCSQLQAYPKAHPAAAVATKQKLSGASLAAAAGVARILLLYGASASSSCVLLQLLRMQQQKQRQRMQQRRLQLTAHSVHLSMQRMMS
jgi:hypothetical protein